jgi:hypothetical protein
MGGVGVEANLASAEEEKLKNLSQRNAAMKRALVKQIKKNCSLLESKS